MSLDWVIETYDEVHSTQDIVMGMADIGQPEGHVVQAKFQTQGRGRHGRKWETMKGNLCLSVLLRPACQARDIGQLSLIAGLSLLEAIQECVDENAAMRLSLKWPNDILINDAKCAGLLLETQLTHSGVVDWAVMGIGVNVSQAPDDMGLALNDFVDAPISVTKLRDRFLRIIAAHYADWLQNGFKALRLRWLDHVHAEGRAMTVKIGADVVSGFFHDIDAYGNLRLRDAAHRLRTVSSGEVYLY